MAVRVSLRTMSIPWCGVPRVRETLAKRFPANCDAPRPQTHLGLSRVSIDSWSGVANYLLPAFADFVRGRDCPRRRSRDRRRRTTAEHRLHPGRRPRLRRCGLLRSEAYQDT